MHDVQEMCPLAEADAVAYYATQAPRLDSAAKPVGDALAKLGYDSQKLFGRDTFLVKDMLKIFDNVRYYLFEDGKMPKPMTQEVFDKLELVFNADFLLWNGVPKVRAMTSNGLSKLVVENFSLKINQPTDGLNYLGLSGHDTTIQPWLNALNYSSAECVMTELETGKKVSGCGGAIRFAANMIWELAQTQEGDSDFLVRILFNGENVFDCSDKAALDILKQQPKYKGYCTMNEYKKVAAVLFEVGDQFWQICTGKKGHSGKGTKVNHEFSEVSG